MSAVREPSLSKPDAKRIRREIERLSKEQNKALEMAMYVVMSPTEQNQYDQRHRQMVDPLRQLTALDVGDVSKLSAKMVELSLQKAQRNPTLRRTVPSEVGPVSSSLLWSSADLQRIVQPPMENAERSATRVGKAVAPATPLNSEQVHGTRRELRIANFVVSYSQAMVIL